MNMKYWHKYLPKAIAAKKMVAIKIGASFIVPDEISSVVYNLYSAVIFKLCPTIFDVMLSLKLISDVRYISILHKCYLIQYSTCHLNKNTVNICIG